MSFSFYIYYEINAQNEDKVRAVALALQHAIADATGIQGRLLCRRDKTQTWMEVYEGVPDAAAFQSVLESEVRRLRFAELLAPQSRRMTELFKPL
ncbi:MAG: hypothetical protein A3H35_08750 [Betaproteobacteria bacterium RIFCSPLOWO2_02_FULL_62_17]|nr:MAG: hypothetical protein A3H35_08750 [Betaproteobacteria bacterium RIFCSPLOWO2_02_FULL_62_17]